MSERIRAQDVTRPANSISFAEWAAYDDTLSENETLTGDPLFPNWQLSVKTILDSGSTG